MAAEDEISESNTYSDILQEMNQEQRGQLYLASVMNSWEEAYDSMKSFVFKFKKELGPGNIEGESVDVYYEMMDKSAKSMMLEESEYRSDHHVENAFLYFAREEPELEAFREAVTSVIKEEKEWADYAQESF